MNTLRQKLSKIRKDFNSLTRELNSLSEEHLGELETIWYHPDVKPTLNSDAGDFMLWCLTDRVCPEFLKILTRMQNGFPKKRAKKESNVNGGKGRRVRIHSETSGTKRSSEVSKPVIKRTRKRSDSGS